MANPSPSFKASENQLFTDLEKLPPALSQKEAHEQISRSLHAIEDARMTYSWQEVPGEYGIKRMAFWPLEKMYWGDLERNPISCRFRNSTWVRIYQDGAIKIAKERGGEEHIAFEKKGGALVCDAGHILSDRFGTDTPIEDADPDFVFLAINAASAFSAMGCESCDSWATLLDINQEAAQGKE